MSKMFGLLHPLSSIDPSVGKVDSHALSQETLMELLIQGIDPKERICGTGDVPESLEKWRGLVLNHHHNVLEIRWDFLGDVEGTLDVRWIPLTVVKFGLRNTRLSGNIDLMHLPDSLGIFVLRHNRFYGSIDLRSLPEKMIYLGLQGNAFEGSVNLLHLPLGLTYLGLGNNNFYGHTDFSRLPESLIELDVKGTELSGEISANRKIMCHTELSGVQIV